MKDEEHFEKCASELQSKWTEPQKLDARMKLLDATCKKYMLDHKMKLFENSQGTLSVIEQIHFMLGRSLIDEIDQYKVPTKIVRMHKSPNCDCLNQFAEVV